MFTVEFHVMLQVWHWLCWWHLPAWDSAASGHPVKLWGPRSAQRLGQDPGRKCVLQRTGLWHHLVGVLAVFPWGMSITPLFNIQWLPCRWSHTVVNQHLLRRQLLRRWYLRQQRVRVRVMIGFLVWGRIRIKIRIRVRVGVTFNVSVYRRSKCRTFHTVSENFISTRLFD